MVISDRKTENGDISLRDDGTKGAFARPDKHLRCFFDGSDTLKSHFDISSPQWTTQIQPSLASARHNLYNLQQRVLTLPEDACSAATVLLREEHAFVFYQLL